MRRLEGWEQRMQAVIDAARDKEYRLGEHDCFNLVCDVWEAITGEKNEIGEQYRHGYSTQEEAMALIAGYGPFIGAFSAHMFKSDPKPVALARRGDVVAANFESLYHLGICVGMAGVFLAPTGILLLPLEQCTCAWSVG